MKINRANVDLKGHIILFVFSLLLFLGFTLSSPQFFVHYELFIFLIVMAPLWLVTVVLSYCFINSFSVYGGWPRTSKKSLIVSTVIFLVSICVYLFFLKIGFILPSIAFHVRNFLCFILPPVVIADLVVQVFSPEVKAEIDSNAKVIVLRLAYLTVGIIALYLIWVSLGEFINPELRPRY